MSEISEKSSKAKYWKIIVLSLFFITAALVLRFTPLSTYMNVQTFSEFGQWIWNAPYGPVLLTLVMTVAVVFMVPVNFITLSAVLFLPPLPAIVTTYVSSLLAAMISYQIARVLGAEAVFSLVGKHVNKIRNHALFKRSGPFTVALIRFFPIAPFTVVNLVFGACKIRFRDFVLGTMIGLAPGKIMMAVFADRIKDFLTDPSLRQLSIILSGILALVILGYPVVKWAKRRYLDTEVDDKKVNSDKHL